MLALLLALASVPEVPQALSPCAIEAFVDLEAREEVEELMFNGEPVVRIVTRGGGFGRDAMHQETWWFVRPRDCRAAGLVIVSAGGSPRFGAGLVHAPKQAPPTAVEQAILKSWAGFVQRDARDPADQLALAPRLPKLAENLEEPEFERQPRITVSAKRKTRAIAGQPVPQRVSWKSTREKPIDVENVVCPCWEIFGGTAFEDRESFELPGDRRLELFHTRARNQTGALAITGDGLTRWIGIERGPITFLGLHDGLAWLRIQRFQEAGGTLLAIEPATGTLQRLGFAPADRYDPTAIDDSGVTLSGDREIQLGWSTIEDRLRARR